MYRITVMSGNKYAVEMHTSGRCSVSEMNEIEDFVTEGNEVYFVEDYEDEDAELIVRDFYINHERNQIKVRRSS